MISLGPHPIHVRYGIISSFVVVVVVEIHNRKYSSGKKLFRLKFTPWIIMPSSFDLIVSYLFEIHPINLIDYRRLQFTMWWRPIYDRRF